MPTPFEVRKTTRRGFSAGAWATAGAPGRSDQVAQPSAVGGETETLLKDFGRPVGLAAEGVMVRVIVGDDVLHVGRAHRRRRPRPHKASKWGARTASAPLAMASMMTRPKASTQRL